MAAILLHVWSSRVETLEAPDWCILDLDPKDAPFTDVVTVAKAVHALCDDIGLPTGIKTCRPVEPLVLMPVGRPCTRCAMTSVCRRASRRAARPACTC